MSSLQKFLPFAVMISLECLDVGLTTLSKAAFSEGLNHFVFVVYSNALAAIILCPLAFFVDRGKRPPLTRSMLGRFFLLALCGISVMQNCVFTGVSYTSPTLATAMGNLIPAFTFVLSLLFRVEKVNMRSSSSQLKVLGTLISVGGAMIVTLYKGPVVRRFWSLNHDLHESPHVALRATSVKDWMIGSFFLAGASISWSIWNIMQAIIGTGLTYTMQTWCNSKKGPLFVSMFKPVGIVIAAIASAIFLGIKLHYASVVGAFFIVLGFYAVIWGQSKDTDNSDELSSKGPVKCESNLIDNDPSEYKQLLGEHSHTGS